ncbi:hypothetical protein D3C72_1242730 [compost metagenome]
MAFAPADQCGLGHNAVDAVNDAVNIFTNVLRQGFLGHEIHHRMHLARWVDRPQAFSHDLGLGPTDIALLGMQLAVGVADANVIEVEQGDFADTATGHSLCRPGADTTNADDCHMGLAQALQAVVTV